MKPLAYIDCETTGTDTANDAIWELGIFAPDAGVEKVWRMKPWKPIPPDVEELSGIKNADLADCPPFKAKAREIADELVKYDLAGFNVRGFDIPIIWEECYRAGIICNLNNTLIIDHGVIFKKKEERSLSAAVPFYCKVPHEGAHGAMADCKGTRMVAIGQMVRYPEMFKMSRKELAKFSEYDDAVKELTFDGKIIEVNGVPCLAFGKYSRTNPGPIKDDLGFARWILTKDFPQHTKLVVGAILDKIDNEEQLAWETKKAERAKKA